MVESCEDHNSCCFNSISVDSKIIELLNIDPGEKWKAYLYNPIIINCIKGEAEISHNNSVKKLNRKMLHLYPPGNEILIHSKTETIIIVFRIKSRVYFCDRLSSNHLLNTYKINDSDKSKDIKYFQYKKHETGSLKILGEMENYMNSLYVFLKAGINCTYYHELKINELFFIFRFCYAKDDLYKLFYPILNVDFEFNEFIMKHYKKVKKVSELAQLYNYSLSGFDKLFKRIYGISAGKWLKNQKAKEIYYQINRSDKSLKDISYEYGFSSPSHFNDYSKLHFGATPGELREKSRKG